MSNIAMIDADRRVETLVNQLNELVDRFRNQGVTAAAVIGSLEIVKAELLHDLIAEAKS